MKNKEYVLEFIAKQKVSFIASVDSEGYPNQKAMLAPRKIESDAIYFTTNTSSMRVEQYAKNNKASVYFYSKGRFRYEGVMLIGEMEVLTDEQTKQDIWHVGDMLYYKKGVTDPDYCVLKFTAKACRYYCDFKSYNIDW